MSPVAARLLSVDRLLLHGGRGPHTRRTDTDAAKQRTVAYLSCRGRGSRCFCRRQLITIVTPLSRPISAKTAASVGLCSVYRKQERPLFIAALEQTSNVPTDRNVGRSSDRVRRCLWDCVTVRSMVNIARLTIWSIYCSRGGVWDGPIL